VTVLGPGGHPGYYVLFFIEHVSRRVWLAGNLRVVMVVFMVGCARLVACCGTLARWHASFRQSVFVCRSNAGLTGTQHGTQLPPQEPSDGWLGTRPGQPSLKAEPVLLEV
jgi:hypothetical protein